jgi:hypothetical protein
MALKDLYRTIAFNSETTTTPSVRQGGQYGAGDDNPAVGTVTLTGVLAGSSILVFVDDENFNGSPIGSGAPYPVTISDTQGGSYTSLGYVPDQYDLDSTEAFLRKNVASGSITVTCNWTTNQWHGLVVCEVANVGTSPTVTYWGLLSQPPSTTADLITTGTHNLGSSPALVVSYGRNATDIAPSAGYPAAGTGFTQILTGVNWNGKEGTTSVDSATLESRYYSNPGTVAATFTARSFGTNPETFLALAVAFQ